PVDSTRRVIDDRVGSSGGSITTGGGDTAQLFGPNGLNSYADTYHLGDAVMWVQTEDGGNKQLIAVNPFTGQAMTVVDLGSTGGGYYNIAMRNDGNLIAVSHGGGPANSGNYVQFNTATGQA